MGLNILSIILSIIIAIVVAFLVVSGIERELDEDYLSDKELECKNICLGEYFYSEGGIFSASNCVCKIMDGELNEKKRNKEHYKV